MRNLYEHCWLNLKATLLYTKRMVCIRCFNRVVLLPLDDQKVLKSLNVDLNHFRFSLYVSKSCLSCSFACLCFVKRCRMFLSSLYNSKRCRMSLSSLYNSYESNPHCKGYAHDLFNVVINIKLLLGLECKSTLTK